MVFGLLKKKGSVKSTSGGGRDHPDKIGGTVNLGKSEGSKSPTRSREPAVYGEVINRHERDGKD